MLGTMRRASYLAVAVLAIGLILPSGIATGASGDNPCYRFKQSERKFRSKINYERAERGLDKLKLDPELSKAAKVHTRRMVRKNLLHHTPTDKLKSRVTNWNILGENVGVGGSVSSLHRAFMDSQAHADNVLYSSFRRVGVGVKTDGDGRKWVTIIFEAKRNPGTTLKMPSC